MNLPMSSKYRGTPHEPVTDADREELTRRLNQALEDGRFDPYDYRQLLDQVYAANQLGDLVPIVEQLPPLQTAGVPATIDRPVGRPGELSETKSAVPLARALVPIGIGATLLVVVLVVLLVML